MKKPLTKYPFQKGTQCSKSIWLHYFQPELKTPPSEAQQMIMDKGTEVGIIARNLYPGGIDVSQNNMIYGKALFEETKRLLQEGEQVLYEASFETLDKSMNFKADIFIKCERKTKLIEVKSSTSMKAPEHVLDLAFQYYVLKNSSYSGPPIEVYIAYINNQYIREEELDIDQLFTIENVTRRIVDAQVLIVNYLNQFRNILDESKGCPKINVSEACFKPYTCSFFDNCFKNLPATTVFNISRLRKSKAAKFIEDGIVEPRDLPAKTKLSIEQWTEINAHKTGKPVINRKEIRTFLDTLELNGPTLWMDFESFMTPIPEIIGTRSYQQICFQYCVLVRDASGNIERREFIAERGSDPRKAFITRLLKDTKTPGNIIVYNEVFEKTRLRELAKEYPELASEIENRISRIKDLLVPFAKRYYFHPMMNGSASIKAVLPCLVTAEEVSYNNLKIKNGNMAMNMYEKFHTLSLEDQIETRRALLEYCHVDCLGMVKVAEALQELVTHKPI